MQKIIQEKYTIAVIEDEEVIARPLIEELESAGFDVIKASDGKEGLDMVLKEKPDLILLDIVMPNLDGMTMMHMLRASGAYGEHVPIILLTNLNVDDKIIGDITKDAPAYYLIKAEYSLADVIEKVKACLSARPSS